jgi:hypothetical protein
MSKLLQQLVKEILIQFNVILEDNSVVGRQLIYSDCFSIPWSIFQEES